MRKREGEEEGGKGIKREKEKERQIHIKREGREFDVQGEGNCQRRMKI